MIRDIFLPSQIRSYYLFEKRIVGIVLGRTHIQATLISQKGYKKTLEALVEETIENSSTIPIEERNIKALHKVLAQVGKYDYLYSSISSSLVVFKELTLPFLSLKKIKMVLPFEIESLLPFSLDTAIVDAIITQQNITENSSDILVAAIKKEYIENHIRLFESAGVLVDKITIDMFELYSLFLKLNNHNAKDIVALIDINTVTTNIAIIIKGQLKYIRSISKGIIGISKKLQQTYNIDSNESSKYLIRFGVLESEKEQYALSANQAASELITEIAFTISSYISKLKNITINKIVLTGPSSEIPGFAQLVENILKAKTEILDIKKVVRTQAIDTKLNRLPNSFIVSLATALSEITTEEFNLQQLYPQIKEEKKLNQQILAIFILLGAIFTSFMIYSFLSVRELRKAHDHASSEALTILKKNFNIPEKSARSLKMANKAAQAKLVDLQKKWSPLSHKSRFSFLKYLYELSRHINRTDLDLDLSSITMDSDEITLKGSVKDVDALRKLESQLKSDLFILEEPPQTPDFKQKPIKLNIKNHRGE